MSIVHIAFYPSDWLAGTRAMSAEETGVYITLIAHMYEMAGPIDRDDQRLYRMCGCKSKASFIKSLNYLMSEGKIIDEDGALYNEKVAKVIKETIIKSTKASEAAQSRWNRKPNKNNGGANANASQTHMLQPCQPEPEPEPYPEPLKEKNNKKEMAFESFWEAYPKKVGKGAARTSFFKALEKTNIENMLRAIRVYIDATDPNFYCNPSTWLNQDRWEDQPTRQFLQPINRQSQSEAAAQRFIERHSQNEQTSSRSVELNQIIDATSEGFKP